MSLQVNSLVASKSHMAGFDLSQELFKAAYDMAFYSDVSPLLEIMPVWHEPYCAAGLRERAVPGTGPETGAPVSRPGQGEGRRLPALLRGHDDR